jgi:hypothetical protein
LPTAGKRKTNFQLLLLWHRGFFLNSWRKGKSHGTREGWDYVNRGSNSTDTSEGGGIPGWPTLSWAFRM